MAGCSDKGARRACLGASGRHVHHHRHRGLKQQLDYVPGGVHQPAGGIQFDHQKRRPLIDGFTNNPGYVAVLDAVDNPVDFDHHALGSIAAVLRQCQERPKGPKQQGGGKEDYESRPQYSDQGSADVAGAAATGAGPAPRPGGFGSFGFPLHFPPIFPRFPVGGSEICPGRGQMAAG